MRENSGKLLAGKTALVTGSGRGLGRAFAETLAKLGCRVGIHGMRENGPAEYGEGTTLSDTARKIGEQYGVDTLRLLGDLTDHDQTEGIVHEVTRRLGPIDILVHNAGGDIAAKGGKPNPNDAIMIKEEDIRSVLDRNLLTTILINQRVSRGSCAPTTSRSTVWLRATPEPEDFSGRGMWKRAASLSREPSSESRWSTRWPESSNSSPDPWENSSPAKPCGSTAGPSAGRPKFERWMDSGRLRPSRAGNGREKNFDLCGGGVFLMAKARPSWRR